MYCLSKFCCICMNKSDLKHVFDVDNDGVSHYNKLISSIAEMDFKELDDQRLICGECCVTLNTVYNFRQTCLRSKKNLITYTSQLQTFSNVRGILSVRLTDIKHDIKLNKIIENQNQLKMNENKNNDVLPANFIKQETKVVKEEVFIKCEPEDSAEFPVSVKVECESEDDVSSAYEDSKADRMNEDTYGHVKEEYIEDQTMTEDKSYIEFTKTGIQVDPLAVVKVEPMSDTETPQDGSTSQETSGKSRKSVGNKSIDKNAKGSFECEICGKKFNHKWNLETHMATHTGERPYTCDICNKTYVHRSQLNSHKRGHSGVRPYECEICKKSYLQRGHLNTHMLVHSNNTPNTCEICNKSYIHQRSLAAHMQTHFKTFEKVHECETCNKKFLYKHHLTKHMQIHFEERPYECEICKKTFHQKCNLTKHLLLHSDNKPHECEICKKTFGHKSYLIYHMRMHSGEKPFQCEICKKSFNQKGTLTKHLLIHTNERPFKCEICNKGFLQKSDLNGHMITHSGEKPYQCEICNKCFAHKKVKVKHMLKHTDEPLKQEPI